MEDWDDILRRIILTLAVAGLLLILLLSVGSCCTPKTLPPQIIYRDSIHTIIRDRVIRDTVPFYVPAESSSSVTPDDSSHLETNFASSDAWIKDGLLHHVLKNKDGRHDIPHETHVTDTTTTHTSETTVTPPPEIVEVEKELTLWQKICIKGFPWTLGLLLACLAWIFRRPLLRLLLKR